MNLIDNLNWRYATKAFDAAKKVDADDLSFIKEAIRLSASSYGLQLYKVLIVTNDEIRQELKKASWDQQQITDASHLFIFCNYTIDHEKHVDDFIDRVISAQGTDPELMKPYRESIKKNIANKAMDERISWTEKQTYLALGHLLVACAELKIDACPMEGFDKQSYNRILGLDEMGLNAAVIAPIGYRSKDDDTQFRKKVRKSHDQLFEMA